MNWQQPVSLAVVAITGFLFVRHEIRVRKRARNRACGSGDCGCGETGGTGERRPASARSDIESEA